jgi:hypothetical protein
MAWGIGIYTTSPPKKLTSGSFEVGEFIDKVEVHDL